MFLRTPFQAQELNLPTIQYTKSNYDQVHGEDERDGLWIPAIYGIFADVNNTLGQILDHSQNVKSDIAEAILGLSVHWERLQSLFEKYGSKCISQNLINVRPFRQTDM